MYGASELTIDDCTLNEYTRDGIVINGDASTGTDPDVTVSDNILTGSSTPLNGIMYGYGATGTISGNSVSDHTRSSPWAAVGIMLHDVTGVTVSGNTVDNCKYGMGLYSGSDNNTIDGNTIIDSLSRGLSLDDSDNNTVTDNTITGLAGGGDDVCIGLSNGATGNVIGGDTALAGNDLSMATSGSGLLYVVYIQSNVGSGSNTIKYNDIDGGKRSVQIDGGNSGTTTFSYNTIGGTTAPSFSGYYMNAGSHVVSNNVINDAVRPIEFWGAANVTISGNTISGTTFDMINAGSASGTVTISGNTLSNIGTASNGITARSGVSGLTISGNEIYYFYRGISIESGCTATVNGNNDIHHTQYGIYSVGIGSAIDANSIHDNSRGIYVNSGSTGLAITDNTIEDNTYSGVEVHEVISTFTGNTVEGNARGIETWSSFTGRNNYMLASTYAVFIVHGVNSYDVSQNWWGDASGPNVASGGPGTGSRIITNGNALDYDPWYLDAAMTTLSDAPRNPVYVDAVSGSDSNNGSTQALAKKTLQVGIDIAAAAATVNADTGTYNEHITIDKPLTLQASSSPVIDGGGSGTAVTISASSVYVTGFTIQNAVTGVLVNSGTSNELHFNNIINNVTWGLNNTSGNLVDAKNNYWGDGSGPSGAGPGAGNAVSANVDYDPWTGMSTETVVFDDDVAQGETVTNDEAEVSVTLDSATGTTDITVAEYTSPPPDTPSFGAGATYVDVQLSDPGAVTELTITFAGMAADTVIYFYLPGTGWIACSNQTYAAGTITVIVTDSTVPTLAQLTGTVFAEGSALGNINGDSVIDVLDVRLCLQIATGYLQGTGAQRAAADVDQDGDVDMDDVTILAEYAAGIRTALPGGTSL